MEDEKNISAQKNSPSQKTWFFISDKNFFRPSHSPAPTPQREKEAFGMKKSLNSRQVEKIKKFGRKIEGPHFLIKYLPGGDFSYPAIIISAKTEKKTTVRSRLKRIIRNIWQKEGKTEQLAIFVRSVPAPLEAEKEIKTCFAKLC